MNQKKGYLAVGASLALALALLWVLPSLAASGDLNLVNDQPNLTCPKELIGYKPSNIGNTTSDGTYHYFVNGMGLLTVEVVDAGANNSGPIINWSSTFGIQMVIVSGGSNHYLYNYNPASYGDTGLTTPINKGDQKAGLSHIQFCYSKDSPKKADFGDLPDGFDLPNPYSGLTLLEDGARHIPITPTQDVKLGVLRDLELNGIPHSEAMGDNSDGQNDEDGVERGPSWGGGQGVITVTVNGGPACLTAWVDYFDEKNGVIGRDNKFTESEFVYNLEKYSERVIDNEYLEPGEHGLSFSLPPDFANISVFARFRLVPAVKQGEDYICNPSTAVGLTGSFNGGEIEDYAWTFGANAVELKKLSAIPQQSASAFGLLLIGIVASLAALWVNRRSQ